MDPMSSVVRKGSGCGVGSGEGVAVGVGVGVMGVGDMKAFDLEALKFG